MRNDIPQSVCKLFNFLVLGFSLVVVPGCNKKTPNSDSVILPKKGIQSCQIGADIELTRRRLNGVQSPDTSHVTFDHLGIETAFNSLGQIVVIWFRFQPTTPLFPDVDPQPIFQGQTDKGIGRESTIADVRDKYGDPTNVVKGTSGGIHEQYMFYDQRGIEFQFVNKKLIAIRVYDSSLFR